MGKRGIQPRYTQAEIVAAAIELIDRDPGTELTNFSKRSPHPCSNHSTGPTTATRRGRTASANRR